MKLLILVSTLVFGFANNLLFAQFNNNKTYEHFKFLKEDSRSKLLNNNKNLVSDHLVISVHSPDRFSDFFNAKKLPAIIYLNDEWAEQNPDWIAKFSNDPLFELRYAKFIDSSNGLLKNPKMFAFINHKNSVWSKEKLNTLIPESGDLDFHFIEFEFSPIRLRP